LLKDNIKTQKENRISLETHLHKIRLEYKIWKNKTNQSKKANIKRDRIKELEEKLANNLALISFENKLEIKPIKEEINKLIELDHARNKRT